MNKMKFSIASSDGSTDIFADSAGRRLAGVVREDEEDEIIEKWLRPYQVTFLSKALGFKCEMLRALSCYVCTFCYLFAGWLTSAISAKRSGAVEDYPPASTK